MHTVCTSTYAPNHVEYMRTFCWQHKAENSILTPPPPHSAPPQLASYSLPALKHIYIPHLSLHSRSTLTRRSVTKQHTPLQNSPFTTLISAAQHHNATRSPHKAQHRRRAIRAHRTKHERTREREIRLLQVSSNTASPVSCTINTFNLGSAPPYTALSYMWGPRTRLKTIHVESDSCQ